MKKPLLISFLFLAVFVYTVFVLARGQAAVETGPDKAPAQTSDLILYYGDVCPHCRIVEEYIQQNGIDQKIIFAQKEVYRNQANASELAQKARLCALDTRSIGVPFLWTGETCILGDQPIIEYFKDLTE
ncbi:hypothetical protein COX69_03070 [Candidatus Falkowbacteria bacterium CG_4_10_14_0_2_um_filter_48_10]|nr:MAG: hypothetical protein COX69_03070 [Candidatus Falkowbacteria bacterium CG_4_10_14_0_2_um_filter_48_10]